MPCLDCTTMLSSGSALSVCAQNVIAPSSFALSLCYVISEEPRGFKKKSSKHLMWLLNPVHLTLSKQSNKSIKKQDTTFTVTFQETHALRKKEELRSFMPEAFLRKVKRYANRNLIWL